MKKTKIIIPALGLLLLSTAASVTGTVAWFAANATANASGMQVKAKTDNTFLLISSTNTTASAIQSEAQVSVTLSVNQQLYPAAPALTTTEAGYLTTSGKKVGDTAITVAGEQINNATKAAAYTNWYTANAAAPSAETISTSSVRQLTSFTNYVVVQNFYLTVAAGANPAHALTVTPTITQVAGGNDVDAIKFLVTTSDGGYAAVSTSDNGDPVDIKGSDYTISASDVVTVTLYIYVDGNDDSIFTNNSANLQGATVSVQFDVTAGAGNERS